MGLDLMQPDASSFGADLAMVFPDLRNPREQFLIVFFIYTVGGRAEAPQQIFFWEEKIFWEKMFCTVYTKIVWVFSYTL